MNEADLGEYCRRRGVYPEQLVVWREACERANDWELAATTRITRGTKDDKKRIKELEPHALICFLALTLYRVMRMRLKAKGHRASPKTALEILANVQQFTTYIGEKSFTETSQTKPKQMTLSKHQTP